MNHPSSRTPILDSENFDYWKSRIKAIVRSVDEEIWNSCIGGYSHPTKKGEEKQVPKLTAELSREGKAALQANNRALDILFSAVDVNEHRKIANCEIAKEAWDILVTCHEGTDVVKQSKLQRLTTEFEIVTMLEGKHKLNEKSVEEVVGILQTYEADMLQPESLNSKVKPSAKSIAFASSQSESRESDCDDEYDLEAMDIFTKNFKQLFKKKVTDSDGNKKFGNRRKNESSSAKEKKGIKSTPAGPKCYECQGYGHVAHECINKLKKKTNFKANITWDDDSESDNSEEEQVDRTNFMAFGASLKSNLSNHESSDDSENEGSDEEFSFDELKQSYNMLFKESIKINESNLKMAENYNNSNKELVIAKKQVEELQVSLSSVTSEKEKLSKEVENLREKNKVLTDLNAASEDKIESLNIEIDNANILFERLNTGSKKLDKILDVQRPTSDKTGLGFYEASSLKIVRGKPNEVESNKVMPKPHSIDTTKNVIGKTHDIKKDSFTNFIPTCHYCQIKGHIKPKCFQLHGYPQGFRHYKNATMVGSIGNVMSSLVKNKNVKSLWLKPLSENQKNFGKIQTRQIWVKKCDLDCFVAHTTFKAKNSHIWNRNSDCSHFMPSNKIGWGMSH
ncbi:hypothetical protein RHGRI_001616 [Rhododendron griersonianum]|uniref:CCHC-type domain-containing protein n=3 Tax=Rhododendron griersonianum TaxID=479676 RepID=A0AAV6LN05_9ERIC|nr:hypothetical protein RHGRI_001616 [Rhododendron griersonianum]